MPGVPASLMSTTSSPSRDASDDVFALGHLVVLVQGLESAPRDVVRAEERARVARVLAVDDVGPTKELERARREIAQVPNRCRDEHQLSDGPR
jgi:hypothetical protein